MGQSPLRFRDGQVGGAAVVGKCRTGDKGGHSPVAISMLRNCKQVNEGIWRVDPFQMRTFALFLALLVLPKGAWCADQTVDPTGDEIPEIIVTAQKRPEPAQAIPMWVTAVTSDTLERTDARDLKDLLLSIPGVSYANTQLGLANFSIRGISTAAANPTVATYLDDISLVTISTSFSGTMQPAPLDMERIEVLEGPQGTLYGGSSMGGAIKYVSRRPILDEFSIVAGGEVASVDHGDVSYNGESAINLPIVDGHLAIRLAAAYRFDAGYIDNIPNRETQVWSESATLSPAPFEPVAYPSQSAFARSDYNYGSTTSERASIRYDVDDSFTILPASTLQRSDQPNPDEFFTNLLQFENTNRFNQPTHDDFNIYSLDVTKRFEYLTLTALTGYVDRTLSLDRDFSIFIAVDFPSLLSSDSNNLSTTSTQTFSQEIRVASPAANTRIKWTAGVYYSRQRDDYSQVIDTVGGGSFFGDGTDVTLDTDLLTRTSQIAAFGDLTYSINARWDIDAGLRWFDIRQRVDGEGNGVFNGGATDITDMRSTNVGVTPKLSLAYRPWEAHLVYADASKGFRPGGPNSFDSDAPSCTPSLQGLGLVHPPDSYQSDSLWSYEIGSKNEFAESHAIVNAALFYTDWKKIQQSVTLASCGYQFVGNVGAATVKGAELSADLALVANLLAGGNATYIQTRVTESEPGVEAQVGQELLDTPKWMGSAYSEYRWAPIGQWTTSIRGEFQYHGANLRQFPSVVSVTYPNGMTGEIPDATQVQQAYHVVNATLAVVSARTKVRLFVDNLTDAAPYLDFRRPPGFSAATTLRPRTIGVGASTSF
jgi:iron complex outermembrane receptor protein